MKLTRIILGSVLGISFTALVIFLFLIDETDYCEHGSGPTSVHVKVFDKRTHTLIDSVRLAIRYGASMDYIVDTILYQQDGVSYRWTIPGNDCEPYWAEVFNKHYWVDYEDTTANHSVKKGQANEFVTYLKPATTMNISLTRDRQDHQQDTVFLYIQKGNRAYERWSYYSQDDFEEVDKSYGIAPYAIRDSQGKRTISTDYSIESGVDYKVKWILKEKNYIDSLYSAFKATPFDTVVVAYEFKK